LAPYIIETFSLTKRSWKDSNNANSFWLLTPYKLKESITLESQVVPIYVFSGIIWIKETLDLVPRISNELHLIYRKKKYGFLQFFRIKLHLNQTSRVAIQSESACRETSKSVQKSKLHAFYDKGRKGHLCRPEGLCNLESVEIYPVRLLSMAGNCILM
jgi:hypothetical protein